MRQGARRMCEALFDGLAGLGLKIATPRAAGKRGDAWFMGLRPGQAIRFPPGSITADGAVDRLLGALAKAVR